MTKIKPTRTGYEFHLEPRVPRTSTVSEQRARLIGWLSHRPHTWKEVARFLGLSDPKKVNGTLLTLNVSLGYGVETQGNRIHLRPPLSSEEPAKTARRVLRDRKKT